MQHDFSIVLCKLLIRVYSIYMERREAGDKMINIYGRGVGHELIYNLIGLT